MKRKIYVLLTMALLACATASDGQQSIQAQAPGGPGANADWLPANKTGFGTSYTTASNVWFTLQDGRLSEVYYPRIDTPSVRNLDFVVTDVDIFTPIWSGPLQPDFASAVKAQPGSTPGATA